MFDLWGMFGLARPSELRAAGVVGMNRRNFHVIAKRNQRRLYPLVDDKIKTKELAMAAGINAPGMIGAIELQHQVGGIVEMAAGHKAFVVKPAHGSGGKGVLVVSEWNAHHFSTPSGRALSYKELYQHISNILSGLYSLGGQYDSALVEEMVHFSPAFKGFSYQGVPDVRVIVYRGYPAMAMMRLSTKASGGRANLHQGAVGVGLDIRTGRTLRAVMNNRPIERHPDTGVDLLDLQVPQWEAHLETAVRAAEMTGLGYVGADIVLDEFRGPMMLELNARPGLAIQIANGKGLGGALKKIDKAYKEGLDWKQRLEFVFRASC